jgi:hypothetical protein
VKTLRAALLVAALSSPAYADQQEDTINAIAAIVAYPTICKKELPKA